MPTEGFFQRWSRLKAEPPPVGAVGPEPQVPDLPVAAPVVQDVAPSAGAPAEARQPTLEDVALLGADSDYSAFVARGVDKTVQRSAMKKLFSDPHFNTGDGLDLYMGDYNRPDPIPAAMLAALRHSQSFFAQAYPETETGDEQDEVAADPAGPGDPSDPADPVDPPQPSNPEPQMADNTGAEGAASEDSA